MTPTEHVEALCKHRMRVEVAPGHVYEFPAELVAINRAEHYKGEFGGDLMRSLTEDTIPLFFADWYQADDWRRNNMDWNDVRDHAERVFIAGAPPDFDEGWVNGNAAVVRSDQVIGVVGNADTILWEADR